MVGIYDYDYTGWVPKGTKEFYSSGKVPYAPEGYAYIYFYGKSDYLTIKLDGKDKTYDDFVGFTVQVKAKPVLMYYPSREVSSSMFEPTVNWTYRFYNYDIIVDAKK